MKFITKEALDKVNAEYCDDGIRYYYHLEEVIGQIKLMDNIDNIETTLELGPYKFPLVEGGDVLDITDDYLKDYPLNIGKFYEHDGSVTPYPFKDKEYDLVIVCEVLEHLGTSQREVFKELCRISKKAIITLPYNWNTPGDIHHMIDRKIIDKWAQGFKPIFEKIITCPSPMRSRILRVYNFDNINSLENNKIFPKHADFQISTKSVNERLYENQLEVQKELFEEKIQNLEKQKKVYVDELKSKEHIINEVMHSNSWKLTKPFRRLGRWTKKSINFD